MENLLCLVQVLGKHLGAELTMRQLSIETGIPYTSTVRIIKNNKGLFSVNEKGGLKLVSLNRDDTIVKNYLILGERQEAERLYKRQPIFKILKQDITLGAYALLLFGSRAEGTQRKQSDVDLCVISKKGAEHLRFSKFSLLSKLEVNPLFFSNREFVDMLKSGEHNVGKEILKKHVILYGEEYFWNLVWKHGIR